MAKLRSVPHDGKPDPLMCFGIDIMGWRASSVFEKLRTRVYIEAFGSKLVRPLEADHGPTSTDIHHLIDWLADYVERKLEVQGPYRTLEPAFELQLTPVSGKITEVHAKLLASGTVPEYYDEQTGPSVFFETSNKALAAFREELSNELGSLHTTRPA